MVRLVLSQVALALSLAGARPLIAQQPPAANPRAVDSVAQRLEPVIIAASARSQPSARENRALTRQLVAYDREIARLEHRLHHLRTTSTDSLHREIETLSGAALATRAKRLALENRLRTLEGRPPVQPDTAVTP